jgi:hypothetical protein
MATVYKFQISMPVDDMLARNRISNTVCFQHVTGGIDDAGLEDICSDLVAMYQTRYHNAVNEIMCKAYDTDAKPNYPRAEVSVNAGVAWTSSLPREIALCLSFAGEHRGNKSERGRVYLSPDIDPTITTYSNRPSQAQLDWALDFYRVSNESFPDIGGIDWKFGIYSPTYQKFTQSQQSWVNDDWDVQRRRGFRENTRVTSVREG